MEQTHIAAPQKRPPKGQRPDKMLTAMGGAAVGVGLGGGFVGAVLGGLLGWLAGDHGEKEYDKNNDERDQ